MELTTDHPDVQRVALWAQRMDAAQFGAVDMDDPNVIHPTWEEIGDMGRQEYLKDALVAARCLYALGWRPQEERS